MVSSIPILMYIDKFIFHHNSQAVSIMDGKLDCKSIFLRPLLEHLDDVVDLRVGGVLEHLDDVDQRLPLLPPRDDHLEEADGGAPLPLPVLGVRVQPLQHVERLGGVVELAHLREM